jgi:TonB family protein
MKALESFLLAYLLNSLWQVPLVFAAAWVAARMVRRNSIAMEHRIWVGALALEAILPACQLRPAKLAGQLWQLLQHVISNATSTGHVTVTVASASAPAHKSASLPPALSAAIAIVYGCIIAYFVARLAWGLWKTVALRRHAQPTILTGMLAESWQRCARLFSVHNANAATSSDTFGPITIGARHPVLLLPVGWETSFAAEDVAAAIAHEFAHMHRRDFAKNSFYELFALTIAYHPALWLTRKHITESREMLCDAMAAAALEGRDTYAHSLLRLASTLTRGAPAKTLHAIGIFDANIFERRVMNLTQNRIELRGVRRAATTAACLVLGIGTCASALALRVDPPVIHESATADSTVVGAKIAPAVHAPVASASVSSTPAIHAAIVPAPAVRAAVADAPVLPVQQQSQPAAQTTDPSEAMHVSAAVIAGNLLTRVDPIYPEIARAAKVEGAVVLHAIIGKDGSMQSLTAISGPEMLTGAALDAVKDWKYRPYLLNGEPVEVDTTITVNFTLEE